MSGRAEWPDDWVATPARPPEAFAGWDDPQPPGDGAPGEEPAQAPPVGEEPVERAVRTPSAAGDEGAGTVAWRSSAAVEGRAEAAVRRSSAAGDERAGKAARRASAADERAVVDARAWIESVRAQGGGREKAGASAPVEWADPAAPRKRAERRGGWKGRGASSMSTPAVQPPAVRASVEPEGESEERAEGRSSRAGRRGAGAERGERKARRDEGVDPAVRAKEICYRLLAMRAHTRLELAQALRRKEIPDDVAEVVLGKFDNAGLIDDAAFAEMWVRSRHENQGLGRRALAVELKRRGVDSSVVSEAVDAVDDEAEEERAAALVRKRLRAMSGVDEQAKVRRLVGMLARKGYGQGMAYRVVRAELGAEGLDELQD